MGHHCASRRSQPIAIPQAGDPKAPEIRESLPGKDPIATQRSRPEQHVRVAQGRSHPIQGSMFGMSFNEDVPKIRILRIFGKDFHAGVSVASVEPPFTNPQQAPTRENHLMNC